MRTVRFIGLVENSSRTCAREFETNETESAIETEFLEFVRKNALDMQRSYWLYVR